MTVAPKMWEDQAVEPEESAKKVTNRKRKLNKMAINEHAIPAKLIKRIILSLNKPSSVLGLGPKTGSKNVRWENRVRLCYLLRKLVRRHNWTELGGVLSMFLKGTCKDRSSMNNRLKYSVSMELLQHMKSDRINTNRIKNVYDVWLRKNGSIKDWPLEDRFVVHLEFILFCLAQGNAEEAHQAAQCLKQNGKQVGDPVSNLVTGLIFYELWYSTIPKEMQWRDSNQFNSPQHSDMSGMRFSYPDGNLWYNANDTHKAVVPFQCDSDSSVNNTQRLPMDADINQLLEVSMEREDSTPNFQLQDFTMTCQEVSGNEASFSNHSDHIQCASNLFALRVLDSRLLPLELPHPTDDCEDFFNLYRKMINEYYTNAVEYFQLALHSTPPLMAALLPLVQLLLIGGQLDKALHVLEKLCCNSISALPGRLRASISERVDYNNSILLSACLEDSLKRDPTCCHSLAKLVRMHQTGDYGLESLLEMIAMHLDATYAEPNTWRELALCFLKLYLCEEDGMSVCANGSEDGQMLVDPIHFGRTSKVFIEGKSGKSWRLRCRWWLTRHFSNDILVTEIAAGNLQLLTYKATCASHMYGPEVNYVVEAYSCLEKENDRDLLMFLQTHMQISIGIYSNFL